MHPGRSPWVPAQLSCPPPGKSATDLGRPGPRGASSASGPSARGPARRLCGGVRRRRASRRPEKRSCPATAPGPGSCPSAAPASGCCPCAASGTPAPAGASPSKAGAEGHSTRGPRRSRTDGPMTPSCPHPWPPRLQSTAGSCRPCPGRLASRGGRARPRRECPSGHPAAGRARAASGPPRGPSGLQRTPAGLPWGETQTGQCVAQRTLRPGALLLPSSPLGTHPRTENGVGPGKRPRARGPRGTLSQEKSLTTALLSGTRSSLACRWGNRGSGQRPVAGHSGPRSPPLLVTQPPSRAGHARRQHAPEWARTLPGPGAGPRVRGPPGGSWGEAAPLAVSGVGLGHRPQADGHGRVHGTASGPAAGVHSCSGWPGRCPAGVPAGPGAPPTVESVRMVMERGGQGGLPGPGLATAWGAS